MKAKNLINQLTKLGFYMVDSEFFNEDELEGYGTCTLQNDNSLNIDYINITYDDYEILGNVEISINGKNKLVKPSKLIDVLKLYESKKSSYKSLKESFSKSDIIDLLKDLERQPEDTLPMVKLYTNLINFMLMAYKNKSNDEIRKEYGRMTCGEWKNVLNNLLNESKKSARKSLKESRSSILDKEFYDLVEEGYIYDEDENGMNMSYGEYASVSDDLWEVLADELKHYHDFPSAYDAYVEIMDNTTDDAKMFMAGSDDDFYFSIDEDEGTYTFSGEVPFILEKLFKEFQKETDLEMA